MDGAGLASVLEWLRRPASRYTQLRAVDPVAAALPDEVAEQVEIAVKYAGYIRRQQRQVAGLQRLDARPVPSDLDYRTVRGLSREAVEHLCRVRPRSLGQAARIAGVTPADIALLSVWLSAAQRTAVAHATAAVDG